MNAESVTYVVSFDQPQTHYFQIEVEFEIDVEGEIELTLPAWIPGSYLIRDFARHIVEIHAQVNGVSVPLSPIDKQTWRLSGKEGRAAVRYRVYAQDLSVRGAHLDDTHAYFNGTSLFLRVKGRDAGPQSVVIRRSASEYCSDWFVATTLPANYVDSDGYGRYRADNYADLVDHPVEIASLTDIDFKVGGVTHRMVFYGRHNGDLQRIGRDLARVCVEHAEMFGEPLPVDSYLFMTTLVDNGYGGLEHKNSTSLICKRDDLPLLHDERIATSGSSGDGVEDGYRRYLGLCSHEYFHLWNVKRIRPERLARSDLSAEAYTELLWAFEGITSYYDDLALTRAGVIPPQSYLELLAQTITRVYRGSGRLNQSVAESSFYAWTKFYKQDENAPNSIVSYYTKGALVALGLDLTLRTLTDDRRSLDDVMRALWQRYGKTAQGVPEGGIEQVAAEVAECDLARFFGDFVYGTKGLPLSDWLGRLGVGVCLRPAAGPEDEGGVTDGIVELPSPRAVWGATFTGDEGGAVVSRVVHGGAAESAGLSVGDVVIAVDGWKVGKQGIEQSLERLGHRNAVEVHAFRRGELRVLRLCPQPAPRDTCDLWLVADSELTETIIRRRRKWLGRTGKGSNAL